MKLYLHYIDDSFVEFNAHLEAGVRAISCRIGSNMIRFPNTFSEYGQSLGSDELDEEVRRRAWEESVRYFARYNKHAA